jgi:hypothetical protein
LETVEASSVYMVLTTVTSDSKITKYRLRAYWIEFQVLTRMEISELLSKILTKDTVSIWVLCHWGDLSLHSML